jgi:hypothetical protein
MTSACHDGEASGTEGGGGSGAAVDGRTVAWRGRRRSRRMAAGPGRMAVVARHHAVGQRRGRHRRMSRGRTATEEGEEVPTSDGGRISGWWRWGTGTMEAASTTTDPRTTRRLNDFVLGRVVVDIYPP